VLGFHYAHQCIVVGGYLKVLFFFSYLRTGEKEREREVGEGKRGERELCVCVNVKEGEGRTRYPIV
jgi:hypothetical protein